MIYRKLKRTWSYGYINYMPGFTEAFPELISVNSQELADRFIKLGLNFYTEKVTTPPRWMRLTLPFALITMFIMLVGLPITFLISGTWSYPLGKNNRVLNWFKSLGLQ